MAFHYSQNLKKESQKHKLWDALTTDDWWTSRELTLKTGISSGEISAFLWRLVKLGLVIDKKTLVISRVYRTKNHLNVYRKRFDCAFWVVKFIWKKRASLNYIEI